MNIIKFKTDFTQSDKMIRSRHVMTSLNQPSQVHEFVVQLILSRRYNILGINFVVKDPCRNIIEIQIQLDWWERTFNKERNAKICREMSRLVSQLMPIGLCTITLM